MTVRIRPMATATSETVDSLQATLEPLGELHEDHSQLEAWVHDSFAALEKLHSELTEWQSELARKQTELDLREDAIRSSEEQIIDGDSAEQIEHWKRELEESRNDTKILEEENAEQLQELESMELTLVQMEKQLQTSEKRSADLTNLLEVERARSDQEQHQWQGEFKEMRRLLDKQCSLLEGRIRDSRDTGDDEESGNASGSGDGSSSDSISRTAELRRRAKMRREARLQRHQDGGTKDGEDSDNS